MREPPKYYPPMRGEELTQMIRNFVAYQEKMAAWMQESVEVVEAAETGDAFTNALRDAMVEHAANPGRPHDNQGDPYLAPFLPGGIPKIT